MVFNIQVLTKQMKHVRCVWVECELSWLYALIRGGAFPISKSWFVDRLA